MSLVILAFILFLSAPSFSQTQNESTDQLWEVGDRRWTIEEERRYERWVEETIDEGFFISYNIPTDCADAVYAIRWIYARIARLPAAATTKDGKLIGHWSTDWKHLPTHPEWHQDRRFRAVLFYLFPKIWTGTLPFDTYPIRISTDSVTPGTLFLETESHTGLIGRVFLDGSHPHPLMTWESGLPVKVQKLSRRYFFSTQPDFPAKSGLVKFRWPVLENGKWKYLPVNEHPFYSEEQYSPAFREGHSDFAEAVAKRMDPTPYPPEEKLNRALGTLHRLLTERVSLVQEGFRQCGEGGCRKGSTGWELYHTTGHDEMVVSLADHLSRIIAQNSLDQESIKRRMEAISIEISNHRSVSLYDVYQNPLWLSSHPGDSLEARWGLNKCEMIHAKTQMANHSIAFIEKTYRKKDPRYADFSIRQQQHLLARLGEEWNRSACREPLPFSVKQEKKPLLPKPSLRSPSPPKTCERIRREIHATHHSIDFIERTYGKKDPEYAFFSIQQQQHILAGLTEEWKNVGCRGDPP